MRSKPINRDRWPIGFRWGADTLGRVPARTRHAQEQPPVSEHELARTVHEYRRLHEEHRHARAAGSARRKLEGHLRRLRRKFERLVDEAPLASRDRQRWRNALSGMGPTPAPHADVRPLLYRGRSNAGSELLLLPMPDGTLEAFVDGAAVEVLDRADELERTDPEFAFVLDGTTFHETFAVPKSTLAELREAIASGRAPRPENLRELIEDGLVDGTLGLTARGRRALALDREPARPNELMPVPEITTRGRIPRRARAQLADTLDRLARLAPRPVLHVRGSLTHEEDPALERPAVAKATLDLGRHAVRAHAAAPTEHEAIDLLAARVRRKLRTLAERAAAERHEGTEPAAGEWRHRSTPRPRPSYYPRPAAERRVVRRKTYAAAPVTPEEAADEMALLDHDFHLFVDAATGEDTLVHVRPDGTLALRRRGGDGAYIEPFVFDTDPVPVLALPEAIERLNVADEPFLFFIDSSAGRGAVLYHRYDGHYGLVSAES
jgi:ribosome-associated translation inhibitor RaiA